ncbi:hypothetical protein PLICRDRAFT_481813 [Plicaturopsis crispa FD-325 SS-3]|nr:hypothetical protein PLICRDRAFT_481813 [Plicaturopsis crispa FD-325 SS-3]
MLFGVFVSTLFASFVFGGDGGTQRLAKRDDATTLTGDVKCFTDMCISAAVNGSTTKYVLQSTGSKTLGWIAMGFGTKMSNSKMVIMWPNSGSAITLSQRTATGHVMPVVDANPPRVATLSSASSNTSGTQPMFAFTIPSNSDKSQNIIYAFGSDTPSSSAKNATFKEHIVHGTYSLDLTGAITAEQAASPASNSNSSSPTASPSGSAGPLLRYQKLIIAHAILSVLGFLLFLPLGVLIARYVRTISPVWFLGHSVTQVAIAGPIIVSGVALGISAVQTDDGMHVNDTHKRWGIAIFVLYFVQCGAGAVIHRFKPSTNGRRPIQNYVHALMGLTLIAFAFYEVRTGYSQEWPNQTGRGKLPRAIPIVWYIWIVLLPVLYLAGLALLPKQFKQEASANAVSDSKLQSSEAFERNLSPGASVSDYGPTPTPSSEEPRRET